MDGSPGQRRVAAAAQVVAACFPVSGGRGTEAGREVREEGGLVSPGTCLALLTCPWRALAELEGGKTPGFEEVPGPRFQEAAGHRKEPRTWD